jgi:hypothetical protein
MGDMGTRKKLNDDNGINFNKSKSGLGEIYSDDLK